ncbi:MAG: DUF3299 domain-containing protein [Pseudomonadales bacterium]|nr:DUF3299 domain-containing protein [Pseudomonadales bacterium]
MKHLKVAHRPLLLMLLLSSFSWHGAFADEPAKIDWESLMPQDWNPNQVFDDLTDDQYYALSDSELMILEQTAQAMFDAAPVVDAFEGMQVKVPGFVLPLEFSNTLLKEFLLVPYYGACIHTPPPPANQIIHGKLKTGYKLESIYLPVWITGTLNISRSQTQINEEGVANGLEVQSAYSMNVELVEPYIE